MDNFKYIVLEEDVNTRIDKLIPAKFSDFSRSFIQKYVDEGHLLVNGSATKSNYKVKLNDVITIEIQENVELEVLPENLNLDIVYEDSDVVVVNKPKGMSVHPAAGSYTKTLVNGLLYQVKDLSGINGVIRPGIVHRIDKDTTGLLMVAKNDKAHESLSKQLQDKTVTRRYYALVDGVIPNDKGRIDMPIGRDKDDRKKMAVIEGGKPAITNFKVIERFKNKTLVECVLETGRTHQIRVHMKTIGYPLYGDPVYGHRKTDITYGQYLHAYILGFTHPITGEYMEFIEELPEYFSNYIEKLRVEANESQ